MKRASRLLLLSACLPLLIAGKAGAQSEAPEIRSIDPARGSASHQIIIRGRNFSTDEDENIVLFGQVQATVTKAKRKKLVLDVPPGLPLGVYVVTVRVGAQTSNGREFEVVTPVEPFEGDFQGRTSLGNRFNFTVLENRRIATRLRTSFICTGGSCTAGAQINIDQFAEINNGRFEINVTTAAISAKVEGTFLSETRAEGTVEFKSLRGCKCGTGKLTWTATLD